MKVYKTQKEIEKDIKNEVLAIDGDVRFECSFSIEANINAGDINARDINAGDIMYHAFCCAYGSIKCTFIDGRRSPHQEPICLDGKLEIIKEPKESKTGKRVKIRLNDNQIVEGEIVED